MADPIPEDSSLSVRESIRARVFSATQTGIYEKIEDEKSAIRSARVEEGDSFFGIMWKVLKSFIFSIAEMLGFDKQLAEFFGMPIPDNKEVDAVSNQVANTVSKALTDKEFTYGSRQEFEEKLTARLTADLTGIQTTIPSFESRIGEIAATAAANITREMSGQFDNEGKVIAKFANLNATEITAAQSFSDSLTATVFRLSAEQKKQLTQVTGKPKIEQVDIDTLATALAPKFIELQNRKAELTGDAAFATVSREIRETLIQQQGAINAATGMKLDNAGMTVLADRITVGFMKEQLGQNTVPDAFLATQQEHEKAIVKAQLDKKIPAQVAEGIKTITASGVLDFYDNTNILSARTYPGAVSARTTFYAKDSNGHYQLKKPLEQFAPNEQAAIRRAQNELYQFAVDNQMSLTNDQRQRIGHIVADATTKTLADPANKDVDKDTLATTLQTNIRAALEAQKKALSDMAPKNTIDTINSNNSDSKVKYDIFSVIAKGFADMVKDEKSGAFEQLDAARKAMPSAAPQNQEVTSIIDPALEKSRQQFVEGYNPPSPPPPAGVVQAQTTPIAPKGFEHTV